MKQVIVEITEDVHAALKERAKASLRKIGSQLLFEALSYSASQPTSKPRKLNKIQASSKFSS